MLDRLLKKQGFTSKEVSIYTMLMEIGEQPASIIAKKLNISRSATYSCLSRLAELGMVSQISRAGTTYYLANDPSHYLDEVSRKCQTEINKISSIKLNLQIQRRQKRFTRPKSNAHYFSGESGLRRLINLMCTNPSPVLRVFLCHNPFAKIALRREFDNSETTTFHACKILSAEKDIKLRDTIIKQIPSTLDIGIDLIISGDKLAIISFPENFGILIESRLITNAQAKVFDLVWRFTRSTQNSKN